MSACFHFSRPVRLSSQSNPPKSPVERSQTATKFVATLALTPLALCAAQGIAAQTLLGVTKRANADQGYSPATTSTAITGITALRDIPQTVKVVPAQLLRDQTARSMEEALSNVAGVAASYGDGQ